MADLRFNYWHPPGAPGKARVYVQGLPTEGRAFLSHGPGGIVLITESAAGSERVQMMDLVMSALEEKGVDTRASHAALWSNIIESAKAPAPAVRRTARHGEPSISDLHARAPEAPSTHGLDVSTINLAVPEKIVVDHREPPEMVELLRRVPNLTVAIEALEVGDYIIGDKIIVERKSVADFEASILDDDKRLFVQSERIKHLAEMTGVVMIEGDVFGRRQRMSAQQISGAVTYLGVVQALNVVVVMDLAHGAYMLAKMAQHLHGLGYDLALRPGKPKALLSARRFVLEGIPGVSAGLAKELLAHFGSVAAVCSASLKDLQEVPGIGPTRAKSIIEVLQGDQAPR